MMENEHAERIAVQLSEAQGQLGLRKYNMYVFSAFSALQCVCYKITSNHHKNYFFTVFLFLFFFHSFKRTKDSYNSSIVII